MRILVSRLKFLGDIILTTPMLEILRERFPQASIEYLALEPHVSVLEGHPCVDRLHRLPPHPTVGDTLGCIRGLRRGARIDWAFDLFSNPRSALLVRASGARHTVGSARGLRSHLFEHRRGRPEGDRSAIRHHLDKLVPLLAELPAPRPTRLAPPAAVTRAVRERLRLGDGERVVVVHPGSTWPEKAWPTERWYELIPWLSRRTGLRTVVVCPPGEESMAERVAERGGAELLPLLPVSELVALLGHARLYVGNDGGILHAAVAMRAPTVGLFGPTEPDIWFPYAQWGPYEVLHSCAPKEFDEEGRATSQLRELDVASVQRAVERVLLASEASA